jgi:hypothetical protein
MGDNPLAEATTAPVSLRRNRFARQISADKDRFRLLEFNGFAFDAESFVPSLE